MYGLMVFTMKGVVDGDASSKGAWLARVARTGRQPRGLELHTHQFVVGFDQLVSYFHEQLKRHL